MNEIVDPEAMVRKVWDSKNDFLFVQMFLRGEQHRCSSTDGSFVEVFSRCWYSQARCPALKRASIDI